MLYYNIGSPSGPTWYTSHSVGLLACGMHVQSTRPFRKRGILAASSVVCHFVFGLGACLCKHWHSQQCDSQSRYIGSACPGTSLKLSCDIVCRRLERLQSSRVLLNRNFRRHPSVGQDPRGGLLQANSVPAGPRKFGSLLHFPGLAGPGIAWRSHPRTPPNGCIRSHFGSSLTTVHDSCHPIQRDAIDLGVAGGSSQLATSLWERSLKHCIRAAALGS